MGSYKIILSGGGTGGHIYPAIAIADELQQRHPDAEFLFVGAKDRMEMEKVPQAGYRIEGLWIMGLQRKLTLKNLMFPFKLISSYVKARKIIGRFRPDVAIGTGGFASGPLLRAATAKGIPCLIQEQNSYAGITNKILAKDVDRICVAYEGMDRFFPKEKIVLTGNPVRSDLVDAKSDQQAAAAFFELSAQKPVLLVLGGSLGARRINELIESRLDYFREKGMQLLWQCGKLYYETYKVHNGEGIKVLDFVNRMDLAYALADLIISRAGAGSVSELCIVGKPVIFIPSPNVAEDHQTKNAQALVDRQAAIMIAERELEESFDAEFLRLYRSKITQRQLGMNIKKMAKPGATAAIADEVGKLLEERKK